MAQRFEGDIVFGNDSSLYFQKSDGTLLEFVNMSGSNALTVLNGASSVSLIPSANNTYDIGSSSLKYKDLYLAGSIVSGAITSSGAIRGTGITIDGTNVLSTYLAPAAMTPVPTGAAGAITTQTTAGYWTQIGKIVQFTLTCTITDVGTATGDLTITLPAAVPAAANISLDQALSLYTDGVTEASVQLAAKIVTNTKTIKFYDIVTNNTTTITDIENGTFTVSGSYICA